MSLQASPGGDWLAGRTLTVSKFGALVVLRAPEPTLACGDSVAIEIQRARQSRSGRVVWIDIGNHAQCAVEIEYPRDFWGVYFPGSVEEPLVLPEPGQLARPETASLPVPRLSSTPLPIAGAAVVDVSAPLVPDEELVALVTGISAVYNPFTERMVLVAGAPDELTGMLANPVKPGTRLRLVANSRLLYGQVLTVSGQRVDGKSRVRLKILSRVADPKSNR